MKSDLILHTIYVLVYYPFFFQFRYELLVTLRLYNESVRICFICSDSVLFRSVHI